MSNHKDFIDDPNIIIFDRRLSDEEIKQIREFSIAEVLAERKRVAKEIIKMLDCYAIIGEDEEIHGVKSGYKKKYTIQEAIRKQFLEEK